MWSWCGSLPPTSVCYPTLYVLFRCGCERSSFFHQHIEELFSVWRVKLTLLFSAWIQSNIWLHYCLLVTEMKYVLFSLRSLISWVVVWFLLLRNNDYIKSTAVHNVNLSPTAIFTVVFIQQFHAVEFCSWRFGTFWTCWKLLINNLLSSYEFKEFQSVWKIHFKMAYLFWALWVH